MGAGALDAWLVPVVGKKGRPGHVVSVLAQPQLVAPLARVLTTETGTLGLRQYHVDRWAMPRRIVEVDVGGEVVRVKVGPHRLKAEHEDCALVAVRLALPVSEVARQAEEAARRSVVPMA
jgi:pyridinium-3,5-bisthiocarboxylic acid mononucleotide nickel chelatase